MQLCVCVVSVHGVLFYRCSDNMQVCVWCLSMKCYSIDAEIVCNCVCVVSVHEVLFYRCRDSMQLCVCV